MARPPRESTYAIEWWSAQVEPGCTVPARRLLDHERAAGIRARTGRDARTRLGIERTRVGFGGPVFFTRPASTLAALSDEALRTSRGLWRAVVTDPRPGETNEVHAERHRRNVRTAKQRQQFINAVTTR